MDGIWDTCHYREMWERVRSALRNERWEWCTATARLFLDAWARDHCLRQLSRKNLYTFLHHLPIYLTCGCQQPVSFYFCPVKEVNKDSRLSENVSDLLCHVTYPIINVLCVSRDVCSLVAAGTCHNYLSGCFKLTNGGEGLSFHKENSRLWCLWVQSCSSKGHCLWQFLACPGKFLWALIWLVV